MDHLIRLLLLGRAIHRLVLQGDTFYTKNVR